MLQCPSCDTTLDQDFGMVTCKSCKSVLMIDFSGHVRIGSEDSQETSEENFEETLTEELESNSEGEDQESVFISAETNSIEEPTENLLDEDVEEPADGLQDDEVDEPWANESITLREDYRGDEVSEKSSFDDDVEFAPLSDETQFVEEPIHGGVEPIHSGLSVDDEESEVFEMSNSPDPEPVDITNFANSETSSLDEGELVYDLTISRLDSKDLKENFKYVLMDEKLKLNHHEYLKKIHNGKVVIENLNPIKTKRLVEQLQYFDVGIRWKQKRIVMEENSEDTEAVQGATDDIIL